MFNKKCKISFHFYFSRQILRDLGLTTYVVSIFIFIVKMYTIMIPHNFCFHFRQHIKHRRSGITCGPNINWKRKLKWDEAIILKILPWINIFLKITFKENNENPVEEDEDLNEAWPFFTVLDAIATGKVVTLTSHSHLESAKLSTSQESKEELILPGPISSNITPKPTVIVISGILLNILFI